MNIDKSQDNDTVNLSGLTLSLGKCYEKLILSNSDPERSDKAKKIIICTEDNRFEFVLKK